MSDALSTPRPAEAVGPAAGAEALPALIVVTPELPYPPNHGMRVDQWNRYRMLKRLGWNLILVTWAGDEDPMADPAVRTAVSEVFTKVRLYKADRGASAMLRRLAFLPFYSPHVSSRRVDAGSRRALAAELSGLRPAAVVLDGLYGGMLAQWLSGALKLPLIYRAHNVEHLYMARQARAAHGRGTGLKLRLASLHLESYETQIRRAAREIFDISADDMAYWHGHGVPQGLWLPPLVAPADAPMAPIPYDERPYDAAYVGNLNTPNNVEGLLWLVREILPRVVRARPGFRVLIGGSRPSAEILKALYAAPMVDLVLNPPDAAEVRAKGRIMINPILTGSGVNVKSVEMLFTDSPVVTTPVGAHGLPDEVYAAFRVGSDTESFAMHIIAAIEGGPCCGPERRAARAFFGEAAAEKLSGQLVEAIMNHGQAERYC